MKAKLYRIDKGVQYGPAEILMATFEAWFDAEKAAIYFASYHREDFEIRQGTRKETKTSYLFNSCPKCCARWTYNQVADRKAQGTKRCDCGCLFEIDWSFKESSN